MYIKHYSGASTLPPPVSASGRRRLHRRSASGRRLGRGELARPQVRLEPVYRDDLLPATKKDCEGLGSSGDHLIGTRVER
jgi:hypothetical protein